MLEIKRLRAIQTKLAARQCVSCQNVHLLLRTSRNTQTHSANFKRYLRRLNASWSIVLSRGIYFDLLTIEEALFRLDLDRLLNIFTAHLDYEVYIYTVSR